MHAVFERDFVAFSASARFQILRFAMASIMGATLLVLVLRAYATSDFSNIGALVFRASSSIGMGLVLLAVPASFSTVLVHARAGSTLPVLLTTPLSPFSIAAGAFVARTAVFLTLIVATWPPIASSLLFGGVRGSQLFAATAALTATGLIVAVPAYLASAFARRTSIAVVTGYLAAAASIALLYLAGDHAASFGIFEDAAISPLHAMAAALKPSASSSAGPYALLGWSSAMSLGAVRLVAWRLGREGRGTVDAARVAALTGRQCRALRYENPMLDRETRGGFLRGGAGRGLFGLLVASEVVFALLCRARGEWRYLPLHFGVLAMQTFLIVLAVTAAGATSLSAEREGRTLDLVRVTPLSPREIVVGKLLGLFRSFAPCLAVPFLHLLAGAWPLGIFSPLAAFLTAAMGTLAISVWAIFGLSQSLDQPNPNRAVLRTMGAFGIVAVLVASNLGFPVEGAFRNVDPWVRMSVAFGANPVALALLPAAALRTGGSDSGNSVVPPPDSGDLGFALICGALWIALYTTLGLAVYRRLFHMYRTRVDG
jgi:ABC-type transport system involved in multi-copper enzyme maturation permease subunit